MIALKNIARASRVLSFSKQLLRPAFLTQTPLYSFSFMQLFEANKPKGELDPAFKRITKLKGHVKSSSRKVYSKKLNRKARVQKQRLKNHKGLLKRIKIVGPRWNRQFKFQSPGKKHLLRNKSRSNLMRKRRVRLIHKSDMRRVKKLIPYYKRRSLKLRY